MSHIQLKLLTQLEHIGEIMDSKASFEATNPGVEIVIIQAADNYESLQVFRSEEPDLMDSGGWELFNKKGLFIDLLPFVRATPGLEEDLNSGIMKVAMKDGTLPGLPDGVSIPLIMYKKAMLDAAGLPYPTDDWTWDEMIEMARKLTIRNKKGVATQFGFATGPDIEYYEPFVMRNGGSLLSPDGSTAHGYIDSDATVEAFQLIMDMYREFHVCRKPEEPSRAGELHQGFAMIFAFTWFIGAVEVEGIGEEFDVVGLPQMPGGVRANMVYMGATGITTKCKHPELAWSFLKHHVFERPERFSRPWTLPITRSVAEQSGMTTRRLWSRYLQEMDVVRPSGYYWSEKWNSSRQLINEDIVKMIIDSADVRQTLKSWTRFA